MQEVSASSERNGYPGLGLHWRFPARLGSQMRWLVAYMVLSRVPALAQLRSIGLDERVKDVIDKGPPAGMRARFRDLFDEQTKQTDSLQRQRSARRKQRVSVGESRRFCACSIYTRYMCGRWLEMADAIADQSEEQHFVALCALSSFIYVASVL